MGSEEEFFLFVSVVRTANSKQQSRNFAEDANLGNEKDRPNRVVFFVSQILLADSCSLFAICCLLFAVCCSLNPYWFARPAAACGTR